MGFSEILTDARESYRIVVPIFFVVWFVSGWILKNILFNLFRRFVGKTKTQLDDIIIDAADKPILLLLFVSAAFLATHALVPPNFVRQVGPILPGGLKTLTIVALILFVDQLLVRSIRTYGTQIEFLKVAQGLLSGLTHLIVFGLGALVVLDSLGVSITPIIASLGIGSLAVALALQPTLENLFAGFQIVVDQPVKPGQFIRLESGEEGFVERVGWRSTWIRQLSNNTVIIPNSTLVKSRVLNYYYPEREAAVIVNVSVHYNSDLEKVERVTCEVGEKIMKTVTGGVANFKPMVRFNQLGGSSIGFLAILRAQEINDSPLITHEFIKELSKRYANENIVMPYPIVALNTSQEKADIETKATNGNH